jgi:hypothetical protein
MPSDAAVHFLRALGTGLLRKQGVEEAAAAAHAALQPHWETARTLVLDVQFTGFSAKGQLVGGVTPELLRAAGALIVHRVTRIGFTPDASVEDLAAFLRVATRTTAELAGEGIIGAIREAAPRGVYLIAAGGAAYRPAPAAPAAEPEAPAAPEPQPTATEPAPAEAVVTPPAEAPPAPAAAPEPAPLQLTEEEEADLSAFEFVDVLEDLGRPGASEQPARAAGGDDAHHGMFAFFRAAGSDRVDVEASALPGMLHSTSDMAQFEMLVEECAKAAMRTMRSDMHEQATLLLEALVQEAERPDRSRLFRDSATGALRRIATSENLPAIMELLQHAGAERDRVMRVLVFIGGDALAALENVLFRTQDAELRRAIFRRLLAREGVARRVADRAMTETSPKLRSLLELSTIGEVEPEFAQRWLAEAAQHSDPGVRGDVARHAATLGGRPGLRVLLDLLGDADRAVARAALIGLATLGDPAAVPFLARMLNDNVDDALQLGAIAALGRTGSPDALPPLLAIVNRRQLISTKRVQRLKLAAVEAIGRTGTAAARGILEGIASGSDAELSGEARRGLALLG